MAEGTVEAMAVGAAKAMAADTAKAVATDKLEDEEEPARATTSTEGDLATRIGAVGKDRAEEGSSMKTGVKRIVIACEDKRGLDGSVSSHFGHCRAYAVVDVGDGKIVAEDVVLSPYFHGHSPGVIPAFLEQLGADVVLSGGMGHRAIEHFQQRGIEVSTGLQGSVRVAVESYLRSATRSAEPCAGGHHHSCENSEP